MSRFNTLWAGEPSAVIDQLDEPATEHELRAALTNAMRRILTLEANLNIHRKFVAEHVTTLMRSSERSEAALKQAAEALKVLTEELCKR